MLVAGTRIGPYDVLSFLGAGGMGEVWKARDSRLDREVALKILPPSFAADPDRLARFAREAKVLAQLRHPGIAAVHSFEEIDGRPILVMELAEGETLDQRIASGPLPLEEAVAVARQIAEALEEAHEKGIVHRDLKPANVKVTAEGKVKLLDFGLAKAIEGDPASGSSPQATQSPTLTGRATAAGVILGTAAYMSPEQARGKPVDKRADIWAFGVVLWEMLTGKRLFEGETASDVLAAILTQGPDWATLPPAAQGHVREVLRRCLERDPKQRLHDIADARIELTEEETVVPAMPRVLPARRARAVLPWTVVVLVIAASAVWLLLGGHREGAHRPLKLAVLPPSGQVSSGPIDLSLDGRQLAFTAAGPDGRARLYVRRLDSLEARALPGTEGADAPFFSPDAHSVGFFAEKKLKRVDLAGGPARELADAPDHRGGSWGSQDLIVFAPEGGGPIFRVPSSGGTAAPVTTLDAAAQETSHRWPRFLPDGKRFLFMSRKPKPPGRLAVEAGSVEGGQRTRLVESSTGGAFANGRLYFVRETTLLAQSLDVRTLALSGEPVPVAEDVWRDQITDGLTAFSAAADGTLAYRRGGLAKSQLTWFDRQGQRLGTVGAIATLGDVVLSPDDRRVLMDVTDPARDASALFVLDATTGMTTRVTFGAGNQAAGRFSSDGRSIVFSADSRGAFDPYRQEIGATGEPSPLLVSGVWKFTESWSRDGRFLSYTQSEPGRSRDIWILPMTGEARPFPFAQTPADEWGSAFSPDGRFLAYVSDESGGAEVFIRTFPSSPTKWQVSVGGGGSPVWRGDGKELFYLTMEGRLVAVPITLTPGGIEAGAARTLFQNAGLRLRGVAYVAPYAATRDGQRFLANVLVGQAEMSPIVIQIGAHR